MIRLTLLVNCFIGLIYCSNNNTLPFIDGDFMLVGLFPVHSLNEQDGTCSNHLTTEGLMIVQAFRYSLDRANEEVLNGTGVTMGAIGLDSCQSTKIALLHTFGVILQQDNIIFGNMNLPLLTEQSTSNNKVNLSNLLGLVGPYTSPTSVQVANILGSFKIPQISYGATSPVLGNEKLFPYFLRTVPNDSQQASCLVHLLLKFEYRYVWGIYENTDYGRPGFKQFQRVAEDKGICFGQTFPIDPDNHRTNYTQILYNIRREQSNDIKVVIIFGTMRMTKKIFAAAMLMNDANFLWIGSDGWGVREIDPEHQRVANGSISTHPLLSKNELLREYLKSSYKMGWSENFGDGYTHNLTDKYMSIVNEQYYGDYHFVGWAVYSYAYALKQLHYDLCGSEKFCENLKHWSIHGNKSFLKLLKNTSFKDPFSIRNNDDTFSFVNGRDGPALYSIMQFSENDHKWNEVGFVEVEPTNSLKSMEYWNPIFVQEYTNKSISCSDPCKSGQRKLFTRRKCCWECRDCDRHEWSNGSHCIRCPQWRKASKDGTSCVNETLLHINCTQYYFGILVGISILGVSCTFSICGIFLWFSTTPIMKAAGRELSLILLLGILVCYSVVFVIILEPGAITCGAIRCLYSVSYTLCYSAISIKTNRVARIFLAPRKKSPSKRAKYTSPVSQIIIVLFLVGVQCLLNAVWIILKPPKKIVHKVQDSNTDGYVVYEICQSFTEYDMLFALIYPVILLILTTIYACKTRKCPGKFNEGRYIAITCYTTCIVWITFIPVYFAAFNYVLRAFALCAAIELNATVTLVCMFGPKIYVALCTPHKNTRDEVMGRRPTTSRFSSTLTRSSDPKFISIENTNSCSKIRSTNPAETALLAPHRTCSGSFMGTKSETFNVKRHSLEMESPRMPLRTSSISKREENESSTSVTHSQDGLYFKADLEGETSVKLIINSDDCNL